MPTLRKLLAPALATALLVVAVGATPAVADASALDLDDTGRFPAGAIDGTATAYLAWPGFDKQGSGANLRDAAVVANSDFLDSGLGAEGQSLRFSNAAVTANARSLSLPLLAEGAGNNSSYAEVNTFETSFQIASATGAYQEGLNLDVYLDNGSNARPGGQISFLHQDGVLKIGTFFLPESTPIGTVNTEYVWEEHVFSTINDFTAPVSIRVVATFVDGDTDTVDFYVNGSKAFTAPSWEHLDAVRSFALTPVKTLTFSTGKFTASVNGIPVFGAVPATASLRGEGFLVNDIAYSSYVTTPTVPAPTPKPPVPAPAADSAALEALLAANNVVVIPQADTGAGTAPVNPEQPLTLTVPWSDAADGYVDVYAYSTPVFIGTFPVVGGVVQISLTPQQLAALGAGGHTIVLIGQTSGTLQASALSIAEILPATGSESLLPFLGGAGALLLGVGLLVFGRGRVGRHRASATD